jgi:4-hydroxybenzoate polyprenyltransferase
MNFSCPRYRLIRCHRIRSWSEAVNQGAGLAYAQLARIDKPIGTLLLLWLTLWALCLAAGGLPDPWILTVFVVGVF